MSKELNRSTRLTSIKPSGTTSFVKEPEHFYRTSYETAIAAVFSMIREFGKYSLNISWKNTSRYAKYYIRAVEEGLLIAEPRPEVNQCYFHRGPLADQFEFLEKL